MRCPAYSTVRAGMACMWEHVSEVGDGWNSTGATQLIHFLCHWEAGVAQGDKRHSGLQAAGVRGFSLTSGSDRGVYPAWGRLGGTVQTSLFSAFLSLSVSSPFLHPVDPDESCVHPSASFLRDPIKIPHSCSMCEGWAIECVQLEGYSPGAFFCPGFGIAGVQNWDGTFMGKAGRT